MKILDFHLIAYGPFTDLRLDLSGGDCGLHVIYGANEAGKSVSLRALTALFFGVPARTTDNFLHDNQSLRLGARIQSAAGEEFSFVRRKGNKDTLLDPQGAPLPDSTLARFLGGVGEEMFQTLFGIDHEGLVRGGEQILKGGGALGESLFMAGLGGTSLHEVLKGLEEEAGKLFVPRGWKQSIPIAVSAYQEARQKSLQASLSSREWTEHDAALREATARKEEFEAELRLLQSEKNRLDRLSRALPRIAERRELLARLEAIGKVKVLTPQFGKKRREAIQKLERARDIQKAAWDALERIGLKMDAIVLPRGVLDHADAVLGLYERLGSHRKAFRDLPRIQGEAAQLAADAEAMIKELRPGISLESVETLRVTSAGKARIRDLGNRHEALAERVLRSARDVQSLEARLAAAKNDQKGLEAARDAGRLRAAVARIQKQGELEDDLKRARLELLSLQKQGDIELKKLGLWSGSIEELESLALPPAESIDRFDAAFGGLKRGIESVLDRAKRAEERKADLSRKLKELQLAGEVPTELDLAAARQRREQGWELVRRAWLDGIEDETEQQAFDPDNALPAAFEKSVAHADQVSDRLRREADRVASHANLLAERDQCHMEVSEHYREKAGLDKEAERLAGEWADAWKPAGIAPLTPNEMRSWLSRQGRAAQLAAKLRAERDRIEALAQRIGEHQETLGRHLADLGEEAAGPDESLDSLINRSVALVARIEEAARKRKALDEAVARLETELAQAVRSREESEADLLRWKADWIDSMKILGLSDGAAPIEANAVLDALDELFKRIDKMVGLKNRIDGILRDGREFEKDVLSLAALLGPDPAGTPADQVVVELNARLQKARGDAATLSELVDQKKEKEAIILQAAAAIEKSELELRELCREAGCPHHDELEEIEDRSARAQAIGKEIEALEKQLLDYSAGLTIEGLILEAESVDADSLPAQMAAASERIDELERARAQLLEAIGKEKGLLRMMDGRGEAAEAAEKAQGILALVREEANRYIRLRLASAILQREMERYRSENQNPLLKRSSELFSRLTLGSFAGLQADFNEADEAILLGVRPDGAKITVQGMSEGTRDQLYLSLRLASLEKYLKHNEPMPLMVDDILVNFDDRRAEATLSILSDLSRDTQIIFFTHHAHLVELAERSAPDSTLHVHPLGPRSDTAGFTRSISA